jgi:hypothetical protein
MVKQGAYTEVGLYEQMPLQKNRALYLQAIFTTCGIQSHLSPILGIKKLSVLRAKI